MAFRLEFTGEVIGMRTYNDPTSDPVWSVVWLCDGGASGKEPENLLYTRLEASVVGELGGVMPGQRYRVVCTDLGLTYLIEDGNVEVFQTFTISEVSKIS